MRQAVGFDEADAKALAEIRERLAPRLSSALDRCQGVMESFFKSGTAASSVDETQLAQFRGIMSAWLQDLFSGDYGTPRHENRIDIGQAMVRIGLPQQYMAAAMSLLRSALVEQIEGSAPAGATRRITALHRAIDIELAVINDAYHEDAVKRVQEREHAQYQQRLSESEHLASVGQLAASLAHEIKNPLAGISGAIQVLGAGLDENHPHKEIITEALRQIDRLDAAVKDLLIYARPKPPSTKRASLDAIIERALILLREEPAFRSVQVHCKGLDGDHQIVVDEAQMQQVICNLLLNAAHACENAGEITCRVRQLPAKIRIIVEDNGKGMPPEVLARVFEPFYTTKARGTGLGLPICKRIVEAHGGTIDVQSIAGKGTRVTVEIPS